MDKINVKELSLMRSFHEKIRQTASPHLPKVVLPTSDSKAVIPFEFLSPVKGK